MIKMINGATGTTGTATIDLDLFDDVSEDKDNNTLSSEKAGFEHVQALQDQISALQKKIAKTIQEAVIGSLSEEAKDKFEDFKETLLKGAAYTNFRRGILNYVGMHAITDDHYFKVFQKNIEKYKFAPYPCSRYNNGYALEQLWKQDCASKLKQLFKSVKKYDRAWYWKCAKERIARTVGIQKGNLRLHKILSYISNFFEIFIMPKKKSLIDNSMVAALAYSFNARTIRDYRVDTKNAWTDFLQCAQEYADFFVLPARAKLSCVDFKDCFINLRFPYSNVPEKIYELVVADICAMKNLEVDVKNAEALLFKGAAKEEKEEKEDEIEGEKE